uniref:Ubiquitin-like domain-containing protein n=3 Tax=Clastoptera arizonana TaxID=38151 RepID=A0A1B6E715_9HEMI
MLVTRPTANDATTQEKMSMIEGIGDEVIQFFSAVIVILVFLLAWWSTNIREGPLIRTVLILERRSRNRTTAAVASPQTSSTESENGIDTGQNDETEEIMDTEPNDHKNENKLVVNKTNGIPSNVESNLVSNSSDTDLDEPNSADPQSSNENERSQSESLTTADSADHIKIRLKYLNDDQKLVDGRLKEPLGEFKRRHFSIELDADKLVRLIFNGQVLQCENQTLQGYGLYDNCVVHCLVHTPRAGPTSTRNNTATQGNNSSNNNNNSSPPDWNLNTLLYSCLSIIFIIAWYCRYQYAQLFTVSTTVALIALTCIFSVSLFNLQTPNQDAIPQ